MSSLENWGSAVGHVYTCTCIYIMYMYVCTCTHTLMVVSLLSAALSGQGAREAEGGSPQDAARDAAEGERAEPGGSDPGEDHGAAESRCGGPRDPEDQTAGHHCPADQAD